MEVPALEQALLAVDGHLATITLNRPEQRNPLSGTMLRDLAAAFRWSAAEEQVRVVVLTGAGDRAFCAGADLASFDGGMTDLERYRSRDLFVDLFALMASLGKPIVGRINGHALAGGLGLACSCDLVVSHDQLDTTVKDITDKLARKSPVALRLGRDSYYRQQDMEFRAALDYLHGQFALVTKTEDAQEGIKAFFEKREPDFKGR